MRNQDGQKDIQKIFEIRRTLSIFINSTKEIKKLKMWFEQEQMNEENVKKTKKKRPSAKGGAAND
jgi:hypothetical protein